MCFHLSFYYDFCKSLGIEFLEKKNLHSKITNSKLFDHQCVVRKKWRAGRGVFEIHVYSRQCLKKPSHPHGNKTVNFKSVSFFLI